MIFFNSKFFKTKEEAVAFKKIKSGTIASNVKGSHTKRDYFGKLALLGRYDDEEFISEYPYVVSWTTVTKGGH